jgi:uncharacterized membrane protein YgdD (TMEM256/DUF423 family)
MGRTLLISASVLAFLGVGAGAFGAHFLKTRLSTDMLANFETAARYQMYHALALLVVGALIQFNSTRSRGWFVAASWCFLLGTVVFSGSLYALCLTGIKVLGAVTPIGGLGLLAGWLLLAAGAAKAHHSKPG